MRESDLIGSIGVAVLLVAFVLNTFKLISQTSRSYALMNLIGATLACYASWLIDFMPFVILEGAWALVAVTALLRRPAHPS